jgi:hypothetical protein
MKNITAALAKAQGAIENAPLNSTNPHFKSRYADLAAIRDAVIPALSENGIAVSQTIDVREFGPVVVTRLMFGDDAIESVCPIAVGQTYKPQEFGSAVTYARRYSLAAICCIAAEEDDDANAAQTAKQPPARPTQARKGANGDDMEARMIAAIKGARSIPALDGIKDDVGFKADFAKLSEEGKANVSKAGSDQRIQLETAAQETGDHASAA